MFGFIAGRLLAAGVFSMCVIVGTSTGSAAFTLPEDNSHTPSAAFPACIAEARDVGTRPAAQLQRPLCFRSQQEVLAAATGDDRYLTMDNASAIAISRGRAKPFPIRLNDDYIIGVDWTGSNQTGQSLFWYNPTTCIRSAKSANVLGAWNNSVTSAVNFPYSGCANWYHYDLAGQGGALIDCGYQFNRCGSYIGDPLNNRTSSERWTV